MPTTLHISLPKGLEQKVHDQVKTGMYQTASEVVREALRLFFREPSEEEVMAYATQKRLKDIEERGEKFEEINFSELKRLRQAIDKKHARSK